MKLKLDSSKIKAVFGYKPRWHIDECMEMTVRFAKVLKDGGRLYTVIPGRFHLWGLKQAVYDTPYENDEVLPETKQLRLISHRKVTSQITLNCQEDIQAVFRMTPYFFHTSQKDKDKLLGLDALETSIEFVIGEYEK